MKASNTFAGQGNRGMSSQQDEMGHRVGIEKKTPGPDAYFYPGDEMHPAEAGGLTSGEDCKGGRGTFPNDYRPHGLGETPLVKGRGKR